MTATLLNPAGRPSLGDLLVMAAAVAALGLGGARLAAELGGGQPEEAPALIRAAPPRAAAAGPAAAGGGPWPAVFGLPAPPPAAPAAVVETPAPEPEPEPEPLPEEEPDDWEAMEEDPGLLLDYRLKGMIVAGEGGWIMVEIDGEERLFRVGDELPGGERIVAILPEGALIEDPYGGPDVLLAPAAEEEFAGDADLPGVRIDADGADLEDAENDPENADDSAEAGDEFYD